MEPIVIATERLVLKPLGTQYLDTTNEYALDYENTKYMSHLPNESAEETLEFLRSTEAEWQKEEPEAYEFAVLYQDKQIGAVSLYPENGIAEMGWIINRKYWGNGYAFEAAKALLDYFAGERGIKHFIAFCDTENTASYRIMEKLGMVRTGEYPGRRNRAASQESFEYRYELVL